MEITDDNNQTQALKRIIDNLYDIDITQRIRDREIVDLRKIYSLILKDSGLSMSQIARTLGMDHATVHHYLKVTPFHLERDKALRDEYNRVFKAFALYQKDRKEFERQMVVNGTIEDLKEVCSDLREELKQVKEEAKRVPEQYKRLHKIFKLVDERTKPGKEDFIYNKMRRFFNGVYN